MSCFASACASGRQSRRVKRSYCVHFSGSYGRLVPSDISEVWRLARLCRGRFNRHRCVVLAACSGRAIMLLQGALGSSVGAISNLSSPRRPVASTTSPASWNRTLSAAPRPSWRWPKRLRESPSAAVGRTRVELHHVRARNCLPGKCLYSRPAETHPDALGRTCHEVQLQDQRYVRPHSRHRCRLRIPRRPGHGLWGHLTPTVPAHTSRQNAHDRPACGRAVVVGNTSSVLTPAL